MSNYDGVSINTKTIKKNDIYFLQLVGKILMVTNLQRKLLGKELLNL